MATTNVTIENGKSTTNPCLTSGSTYNLSSTINGYQNTLYDATGNPALTLTPEAGVSQINYYTEATGSASIVFIDITDTPQLRIPIPDGVTFQRSGYEDGTQYFYGAPVIAANGSANFSYLPWGTDAPDVSITATSNLPFGYSFKRDTSGNEIRTATTKLYNQDGTIFVFEVLVAGCERLLTLSDKNYPQYDADGNPTGKYMPIEYAVITIDGPI